MNEKEQEQFARIVDELTQIKHKRIYQEDGLFLLGLLKRYMEANEELLKSQRLRIVPKHSTSSL